MLCLAPYITLCFGHATLPLESQLFSVKSKRLGEINSKGPFEEYSFDSEVLNRSASSKKGKCRIERREFI